MNVLGFVVNRVLLYAEFVKEMRLLQYYLAMKMNQMQGNNNNNNNSLLQQQKFDMQIKSKCCNLSYK